VQSEEEEFVNAATVDYHDSFSSNANEETLEDFAHSMDEEEVLQEQYLVKLLGKVMALMKLMTMPTTNLKIPIMYLTKGVDKQ